MKIYCSMKIKTLEQIRKIAAELKSKGKKIVTTNGCFDVLHIGHIRYLRNAKKLGDVLIIGLNTDSSVKQYKGDKRPLVPEDERAEMLSALEFVDYIVKFSERDPRNLLDTIKPDIHVKGGDYKMEQIIEKDVVEKNGGKVVLLPLVHGKSTTNIINRIMEVYGNK